MSQRSETALLFLALMGILLSFASLGHAKTCKVEGVATYTDHVRDVLATPNAYWVASDGGLEEFDRSTHALKKKYTQLDGLISPQVRGLKRTPGGQLKVELDGAECSLQGSRFSCAPKSPALTPSSLGFSFHQGHRITTKTEVGSMSFVGTAGGRAYIGQHRLGQSQLPGRHVTSLTVFQGRLWVGTFNGGLAREGADGSLRPTESPGRLINALLTGPKHLFVGTSHGLFRSRDGVMFERVEFVEDAVVGLAFDGTSVWASTPGALYRIRDGQGPSSDVWWIPGGSRSLQKVSATPGYVWLGTEDRGAIRMKVTPTTMAKDKPFELFDKGRALPSSWSLSVAGRSDGSAWMTTLREGVALIGVDGHSRPISTGVSDWGLSALTDGDGAWIGTQGGAAFVTGSSSTRITRLPDERVHAFLKDERYGGRLWIGTENGLAWCRPQG